MLSMSLDDMDDVGDRGSGSKERTSLRSRVWTPGFLHSMYMAKDSAEAVVSWPAIRKVISWFTKPSSVNPPDSIATERMFLVVPSFLHANFNFSCCTRE